MAESKLDFTMKVIDTHWGGDWLGFFIDYDIGPAHGEIFPPHIQATLSFDNTGTYDAAQDRSLPPAIGDDTVGQAELSRKISMGSKRVNSFGRCRLIQNGSKPVAIATGSAGEGVVAHAGTTGDGLAVWLQIPSGAKKAHVHISTIAGEDTSTRVAIIASANYYRTTKIKRGLQIPDANYGTGAWKLGSFGSIAMTLDADFIFNTSNATVAVANIVGQH